jgi:predicted nucleotidyltransferase component of viral defense system
MALDKRYRDQVTLLVRALPLVAKESCFALKGGTAINLFIRNMPRLSVDIDLTYLPLHTRDDALREIDLALKRIAENLRSLDGSIHVAESSPASQDGIIKLVVRTKGLVQIKIEVTPVLRGCVYDPAVMPVSEKVEDEFGFAEINVLSFSDLYAGKIMAALDRQHPRDLFDVHQLLAEEGINDELRAALIVYLVSHDHSPHSLLNPVRRDVTQDYEQNFAGMTTEETSLEILLSARETLIKDVTGNMPDHHKDFLKSFYGRKPDWQLLGLKGVENLPAVRWRELNLDRSGQGTCEALLRKLEAVF